MILLNALTRGAISFLVIMSLGIGGLMLRDGVDIDGLGALMANLSETDLQQTVASVRQGLQQGMASLM